MKVNEALCSTILIFALDSIPAIFGLTKEPYIVFTANALALMGLRQLYFLLGGLLTRLVYLSKGLAVILEIGRASCRERGGRGVGEEPGRGHDDGPGRRGPQRVGVGRA